MLISLPLTSLPLTPQLTPTRAKACRREGERATHRQLLACGYPSSEPRGLCSMNNWSCQHSFAMLHIAGLQWGTSLLLTRSVSLPHSLSSHHPANKIIIFKGLEQLPSVPHNTQKLFKCQTLPPPLSITSPVPSSSLSPYLSLPSLPSFLLPLSFLPSHSLPSPSPLPYPDAVVAS